LARWTNYLARIIKQRRSAIPIYGDPNHLSGKNERCLTLAMFSQKLRTLFGQLISMNSPM